MYVAFDGMTMLVHQSPPVPYSHQGDAQFINHMKDTAKEFSHYRRKVLSLGSYVPTITNFTADEQIGGTVIITGTNFINVQSVTFTGSVASSVTVNSTTQITVIVPANTVDGPITVVTSFGTVTSTSEFVVDPTIYVNEHFDTVTVPALPSGWSSHNGTVVSINTDSYSPSQCLELTSASGEFVFAYKLLPLDTNQGKTQIEAKFKSKLNPPTNSTYMGLAIRQINGAPSVTGSTFQPGYHASIGFDSGYVDIRWINDASVVSLLFEQQLSITWDYTGWYRFVLRVDEVPDYFYHVVSIYCQRMSDLAWLQPDGTWQTGVEVSVATVRHQLNYVNNWANGGFCMVAPFLGTGQGIRVDDVKFQDAPLRTSDKPFVSTAIGNEVEVTGTVTTDSAGKTGYETAKLNTGDLSLSYWSTKAWNGWAMMDCGANVTPTAIVWAPGQDADFDNEGIEQYMMGCVFEGATSSSGPWTQLGKWKTNGYPEPNNYQTLRLSTTSPGGTYRYIRGRSITEGFNMAAFRVFAQSASSWRPVPPTMTPAAGRYSTGQTVALTCATSGASIYYTTDGTTPTLSAGVPQGTTTLYTGAFTIPSNSPSETTIKAIAYHASGTTTTSLVTTGKFVVTRVFVPDTGVTAYGTGLNWPEDWLDNRGILLNSNTGGITYNVSDGRYYWIGETMNGKAKGVTNAGIAFRGFWIYSSDDLYNWTFEKQILPIVSTDHRDQDDVIFTLAGRPHYLINPSPIDPNKKFVLWFHIGNTGHATYAACYSSPTAQGPYTFRGTVNVTGNNDKDPTVFQDDDGKAYLVYTGVIALLDPATDWTTLEGTLYTMTDSQFPNREAPCLFKYGGYYYFMACNITNFGHSAANGIFYMSATTLTGLTLVINGGQHPWNPTTPGTTTTAYNGQSAQVFAVNGKTAPAFIFVLDYQDPEESPINMQHSRSLWYPMNSSSFPSPGVLSLPFATYNPSWALSVFP